MPEVIINGPAGRIEARYQHNNSEESPVALILHPHPQYGGSMHNKVIYALSQIFIKHHCSTLRFNFRGVGRSHGTHDGAEGELCDAAAALDWLQTHNPNSQICWVCGFSFGAWIGMQLLMRRPEISGFISVSPPADQYDFHFLAPCPSSGLIIHGTDDAIVSEASAAKLAQKINAQRNIEVEYKTVQGCDHFFTGKHDELTHIVSSYVKERSKQLQNAA